MQPFALEGRTTLVTGAASGIGLALTHRLLDAGAACVVAVGRDAERLASLARARPGRVVPCVADLADPDAVDALVDRVATRWPTLSLVVNNAGVQHLTPFVGDVAARAAGTAATGWPAWAVRVRGEIAVNLTAVVALSVGLLPVLGAQPSAAVVNVTSGLALAPKRSAPVYCATKAAVRAFTRALRYQCEDGLPSVRVVEALPPLVDTPMTAGRGRGKLGADACAAAIVAGLAAGRAEIHVGRARLLRAVHRAWPAAAHRLMRDG